MKVLRTPDAAFNGVTDFPYHSNYAEITDAGGTKLRLHYVDEGPRNAPVVLMLHGEPTWCYLYRHMIGPVAQAGLRVLAPDLIGFGRSDKPAAREDYSYAGQVAWMRSWIEKLDLRDITLVCQDWGSLIGLRLATEMPERFSAVLLSNGGLPAGQPAPRAFGIWRAFSKWSPIFPIGRIVKTGTKRGLSEAEIAAYDAPFPARKYKVAARAYPSLVPLDDNIAVPDQLRSWAVLDQWSKPFLCCFSDGDPITRGGDAQFLERVPGTKGQPHTTLHGGHFIQEDDPENFVNLILKVCKR